MASVMGIQTKGIKTFPGMENEAITANIYMDNKKIGNYTDHGFGGEPELNIDDKYEPEFNKRVKEYLKNEKEYLQKGDVFLGDVFNLTEMEKEFKKQKKAAEKKWGNNPDLSVAYIRLTRVEDYGGSDFKQNVRVWEGTAYSEGGIEKVKKENEYDNILIFKKLEDFVITEKPEGL